MTTLLNSLTREISFRVCKLFSWDFLGPGSIDTSLLPTMPELSENEKLLHKTMINNTNSPLASSKIGWHQVKMCGVEWKKRALLDGA